MKDGKERRTDTIRYDLQPGSQEGHVFDMWEHLNNDCTLKTEMWPI